MDSRIAEFLAREGVIDSRRQPWARGAINRAVHAGELVRVLPGVYAEADGRGTFDVRVAAARAWHPAAVIVGSAAAKLTFWPGLEVRDVELAVPRPWDHPWPGFRTRTEQVPPEWVGNGRVAADTWTALDLIPMLGAKAYYMLRRHRWVEPTEVTAALHAHAGRRGTRQRRAVIHEGAWSEAEEAAHDLLRAAGVTGWEANVELFVGHRRCFADILFRRRKVALEVEGLEYHGARREFRDMLTRSRALTVAGYTVLHVMWDDLIEEPVKFVAQVRAALGERAFSSTRFEESA